LGTDPLQRCTGAMQKSGGDGACFGEV